MMKRISQGLFAIWAVATLCVHTSSTPIVLHEIHQYFVNQSKPWEQIPCSEEEHRCLEQQQMHYEADGQCYSVGQQGPCLEGEIFHADKEEALRKGGHFRGSCSNPCGHASERPVAATGECLTRAQVQAEICRRMWYLRPAMDIFGEWVCEWTRLICPFPERVAFRGGFKTRYEGSCNTPNTLNVLNDVPNASMFAEKPADHPLLQYFTNKTYVGREFPCTEEEKECLQYGRLLYSDGKCYVPGQWSRLCDSGQTFHLDWNEIITNGRLQGTCRSPCSDLQLSQSVTERCEDEETMRKICRWDWGMRPEGNAFGQTACRCTRGPRGPPPSKTPPAAGPGRCTAPDFDRPVHASSFDETLTLGFRVPCSEEEFACLREGRVLKGGECHALRTRGPCAEGEELVLDKEALAHARLEAVCKARLCPEQSVLLPIDGRCLTYQQVDSIFCVNLWMSLDEFGGWRCDHEGKFPADLTRVHRNRSDGSCELPDERFPVPIGIS